MPSAVCTPSPWVKSCSANSPRCSRSAIRSVTCGAGRDGLDGDDVVLGGLLRAVEVGDADAVVGRLAREHERLEHALGDPRGRRSRASCRRRCTGTGPAAPAGAGSPARRHMRSSRGWKSSSTSRRQSSPFCAAPAPVQLEEHVRVQVREHLVEVDRDLPDAEERRLGDGASVRAAERTDSSSVGPSSGSGPFSRSTRASSRALATSSVRRSGSTSWSITARPANASLQ